MDSFLPSRRDLEPGDQPVISLQGMMQRQSSADANELIEFVTDDHDEGWAEEIMLLPLNSRLNPMIESDK